MSTVLCLNFVTLEDPKVIAHAKHKCIITHMGNSVTDIDTVDELANWRT